MPTAIYALRDRPLWALGTLDLVPKRERRPWQAAVDLNRANKDYHIHALHLVSNLRPDGYPLRHLGCGFQSRCCH